MVNSYWHHVVDFFLDSPGWNLLRNTDLWQQEVLYEILHEQLRTASDCSYDWSDIRFMFQPELLQQTTLTTFPDENIMKPFAIRSPTTLLRELPPQSIIFAVSSWNVLDLTFHLNVMNWDEQRSIHFMNFPKFSEAFYTGIFECKCNGKREQTV